MIPLVDVYFTAVAEYFAKAQQAWMHKSDIGGGNQASQLKSVIQNWDR